MIWVVVVEEEEVEVEERTAARLSLLRPEEVSIFEVESSSLSTNEEDDKVAVVVVTAADDDDDPNEKAEKVVEVAGLSCLNAENVEEEEAGGFFEKEKMGGFVCAMRGVGVVFKEEEKDF